LVRRDGAEARKERIEKIARRIQAALFANKDTGYISLKKTVATLSIEVGCTPEKIMEYLELLAITDQFIIDHENDQIRKVVS
jgi:hypothetical protein